MPLPPADSVLGRLMATLPRAGRVEWIGLRSARDGAVVEVEAAGAVAGRGLVGDRYAGRSGSCGVNAMRGHGGLCARILDGGTIRRGDAVAALQD